MMGGILDPIPPMGGGRFICEPLSPCSVEEFCIVLMKLWLRGAF